MSSSRGGYGSGKRPGQRGGRLVALALLAGVALGLLPLKTTAQGVIIERFGFTTDGRFEVVATGDDPSIYFRLLQGGSVNQITQLVGLSIEGTVISRLPVTNAHAFFRVHVVPHTESLDTDGDGLTDGFELAVGLDPFLVDSDGNGINDSDEDQDGDTLDGRAEQAAGTNPFNPDTDGDGWPDEAEVTGGSNPLDAGSRPISTLTASPRAEMIVPAAPVLDPGQFGLVLASPGSELVLPAAPVFNATDYGMLLANPGTELVLPVGIDESAIPLGLVLSQPLVSLTLPVAPDLESGGLGLVLARPAAEIVLPTLSNEPSFELGVVLGRPPVSLEFESP